MQDEWWFHSPQGEKIKLSVDGNRHSGYVYRAHTETDSKFTILPQLLTRAEVEKLFEEFYGR